MRFENVWAGLINCHAGFDPVPGFGKFAAIYAIVTNLVCASIRDIGRTQFHRSIWRVISGYGSWPELTCDIQGVADVCGTKSQRLSVDGAAVQAARNWVRLGTKV